MEYITASGRQAYEVEHIWAEQSWAEDREGFRTWYPQEENFREARNRIGALLLIPKSVNASTALVLRPEANPVRHPERLGADLL